MIITQLTFENPTSEVTATIRTPDHNWMHVRGDGMHVKWEQDGEHWHIPYLVKKFRLQEPTYSGHEQTNEGEFEEYYIDPTDVNMDEEVEPEYIAEEKMHHVAGIQRIECTAWLTADEKAWMTPVGTLPRTADYKRTVSVSFMGGKILLRGVWAGPVLEVRDDLVHIELHVDKVEPVE